LDNKEDDDVSSHGTTESFEMNYQSFIFGYRSAVVNLRDLHPLPSQFPESGYGTQDPAYPND
jgi:hypothetical protein